jgi:hypothetical protein
MVDLINRVKLYKSGKFWVSSAALALVTAGIVAGSPVVANADVSAMTDRPVTALAQSFAATATPASSESSSSAASSATISVAASNASVSSVAPGTPTTAVAPLTSVSLSNTSGVLTRGETNSLSITNARDSYKSFIVTSSDPNVVSVTTNQEEGTFTINGLTAGNVTITVSVTSNDGHVYNTHFDKYVNQFYGSKIINFTNLGNLVADGSTRKIGLAVSENVPDGQQGHADFAYDPSKAKFTTSNTAIATVDDQGNLTTVGVGSVTISATYVDDVGTTHWVSLNVYVNSANSLYQGLYFNYWVPPYAKPGEKKELMASYNGKGYSLQELHDNGIDVKFESLDPDVATMSTTEPNVALVTSQTGLNKVFTIKITITDTKAGTSRTQLAKFADTDAGQYNYFTGDAVAQPEFKNVDKDELVNGLKDSLYVNATSTMTDPAAYDAAGNSTYTAKTSNDLVNVKLVSSTNQTAQWEITSAGKSVGSTVVTFTQTDRWGLQQTFSKTIKINQAFDITHGLPLQNLHKGDSFYIVVPNGDTNHYSIKGVTLSAFDKEYIAIRPVRDSGNAYRIEALKETPVNDHAEYKVTVGGDLLKTSTVTGLVNVLPANVTNPVESADDYVKVHIYFVDQYGNQIQGSETKLVSRSDYGANGFTGWQGQDLSQYATIGDYSLVTYNSSLQGASNPLPADMQPVMYLVYAKKDNSLAKGDYSVSKAYFLVNGVKVPVSSNPFDFTFVQNQPTVFDEATMSTLLSNVAKLYPQYSVGTSDSVELDGSKMLGQKQPEPSYTNQPTTIHEIVIPVTVNGDADLNTVLPVDFYISDKLGNEYSVGSGQLPVSGLKVVDTPEYKEQVQPAVEQYGLSGHLDYVTVNDISAKDYVDTYGGQKTPVKVVFHLGE